MENNKMTQKVDDNRPNLQEWFKMFKVSSRAYDIEFNEHIAYLKTVWNEQKKDYEFKLSKPDFNN